VPRDDQTTTSAPRRRPGGRSARVRAAVLSATLAELAERGYAGVNFEVVASRAGVHRSTIYRHWQGLPDLLLDALLTLSSETVTVPDTGSLRGDLRVFAGAVAANLSDAQTAAALRALVSARSEPALADAFEVYWRARFGVAEQILSRARERGELAISPHRLVIEALVGPLYLRALVTGEPLDEGFITAVVDLLLAGAARDKDSSRARRPADGGE
jgi:AcrR family transcriptional regulator